MLHINEKVLIVIFDEIPPSSGLTGEWMNYSCHVKGGAICLLPICHPEPGQRKKFEYSCYQGEGSFLMDRLDPSFVGRTGESMSFGLHVEIATIHQPLSCHPEPGHLQKSCKLKKKG